VHEFRRVIVGGRLAVPGPSAVSARWRLPTRGDAAPAAVAEPAL